MFHILGFLLIIFIAVLVIGLALVGSFFRAIFGFGRRRPATSSTESTRRTYSYQNSTAPHNSSRTNEQAAPVHEEAVNGTSGQGHKKIFTKEEGEYVDFEEVKE